MAKPVTLRNLTLHGRTGRLVRHDGLHHVVVPGIGTVADPDPDAAIRKAGQMVARSDPRYFGYEGARARFLAFFPEGFGPELDVRERALKDKARRMLLDSLPLDTALDQTGHGEAVLKVFDATNLLSPQEKTRIRPLLRGTGADAFIRAAAGFALEPGPSALAALAATLKPHPTLRWLVATYLPFLWQPEAHMLLKPRTTRDFAARVGHAFAQAYRPALEWEVYAELLDLAGEVRRELTDLTPRDGIDVQSFVWVVGKYRPEDRPEDHPTDA